MSVSVEPSEELLFHSPFTRMSKESLFVKNTSEKAIIFKVKTTAPKQYCVRPNAGRIEPKSEIEVQIILQPFKEEPAEDYKCKDKFLVQTAPIIESLEKQDVSSMWSYIETSDKQSMHQHKIKCVFVGQNAQSKESLLQDDQSIPKEHFTASSDTQVPTSHDVTSTSLPDVPPLPANIVDTKQDTKLSTSPEASVTVSAPASVSAASPSIATIPTLNTSNTAVTKETSPPQFQPIKELLPRSSSIVRRPEALVEKKEEDKKLKEALETIRRLEKTVEDLKKAQNESTPKEISSVSGRKLSPSVQPLDAVHQHLAQLEKPRAVEGYPPQVLLGVSVIVFIFTYLFF